MYITRVRNDFLNKFSILIMTAVITSALITGCSNKNSLSESSAEGAETTNESDASMSTTEPQSSNNPDATITEDETTATTVENHELEQNIQPAEGTYVYDYAALLSEDDFAECNNYAELLYENLLINVAVVTTDNIEGLSAAQYAEDAYIDIYSGRGSGLLLLINNDTNEDYLYKTGSCQLSILETTQGTEFYWATQEIINGDYKSAILRLLKLGEACSSHVFDNAGVFSVEDTAAIDALCTGGANDVSILATSNTTGTTNEEICRTYYDRHYKEDKGIMIMLDTATNTFIVVSDNTLPADLETQLSQANELAATLDYTEAANGLITFLKG